MTGDPIERLERLRELRNSGDITEAEYEVMKADVLSDVGKPAEADPEFVRAEPTVLAPVHHSQKFCALKKQAIPRGSQVANSSCPLCGVPLPAKNRYVMVGYDSNGDVVSYENLPPPAWWKGSRGVGLLVVLVVVGWLLFSGIQASDNGGQTSSVKVSDASSEVRGTLLSSDAYIGSGDVTILNSRKAYSAGLDATAYASRVSVPGADNLCLFWYGGGRTLGGAIGDTVTRQFSAWGTDVPAGSLADDWVRELKRTPEGKAAISSVSC